MEMNKRYMIVSTKIDADISQFMKLMKKKYGSRTESEALRAFISEHDKKSLKMAQQIAELHEQVVEDDDDAKAAS